MTLRKVEDGRYRTADGLYEVEEVNGNYAVNVRDGYTWVNSSTHKSKSAAETAVAKLQNKDVAVDPNAPVETEGE
jgi:hypothetical protein